MHLLSLLQIPINELEQRMFEQEDFPVEIEKRQVKQLEERYEAKNTRILVDVNMGESDIVEENSTTQDTEKRKVREKIRHVDETIAILKTRKIEAQRKFEFLSAPKRAEQKKKLD